MKRHIVMDLFHGHQKEPIGDWHSYPNKLPEDSYQKVLVQLEDLKEMFAYFYADKIEGSHFYDSTSKEPLDNVKQWKNLKE